MTHIEVYTTKSYSSANIHKQNAYPLMRAKLYTMAGAVIWKYVFIA